MSDAPTALAQLQRDMDALQGLDAGLQVLAQLADRLGRQTEVPEVRRATEQLSATLRDALEAEVQPAVDAVGPLVDDLLARFPEVA